MNSKIIDGSCYRKKSINGMTFSHITPDVNKYAQKMADLYRVDDVYVLDIGMKEDGQLKVIECGCFNVADLYGCDLNKVIDAVNRFVGRNY